MIDKVISTVEKYHMIHPGAVVVAAVSGGSDSMAMLDVLIRLKERFCFEIIAAHVNHSLRGIQADNDEAFVADYCAGRGVAFKSLKADVSGYASQNGLSFEEAGRKIRYEFFDSLGENILIATAHNSDDRAETFLFNFTRGSSLRGLCSIPPVRDNIIRPVIDCSKAEIIEYCNSNSIPFVTDVTNSDVSYSRNRIRHNVITELSEINPSFVRASSRCIETLREDEDFLSSTAVELARKSAVENGYNCLILKSAHSAVLKRVVVWICEKEKNITPEFTAVNEICELIHNSGQVLINGGVTVRVRKDTLDFPDEASEQYLPLALSEGDNEFYDYIVNLSVINKDEINNLQFVSQNNLEYFFNYDKINGKIFLRSRLSGDRISLNSRGCTKTLKKLFNELSVPPEKRNEIIVIADEGGVIAVCGVGIDSRVAVTSETKRILKISLNKK